jgi:hypothetical protein
VEERCRIENVEVNGQPRHVVVRGSRRLDDEDKTALATVVDAAEKHLARTDPNWAIRQHLATAARVAAACIPDGTISTGPGPRSRDGSAVKTDLDNAVRAAVDALAPVPTAAVGTGTVTVPDERTPMTDDGPSLPVAGNDGMPPDIDEVLFAIHGQVHAVERHCRTRGPAERNTVRVLYRLRAYIQQMRDVYGRYHGTKIDEEVRHEEAILRRAVDEYAFATRPGDPLVHITEPFRDVDHDRTLCRQPSGFVYSTRPDGDLCPTCSKAFTVRLFPRPAASPTDHS